jgi:hypothetical protein
LKLLGGRSQAPVVHACNLSYSQGRDQEDRSLQASLGKQFSRPFLKKKTHHKKGLVDWLKV